MYNVQRTIYKLGNRCVCMLGVLLLCVCMLSACAAAQPPEASPTPTTPPPQTTAPLPTPAPTPVARDMDALLQGRAGAYYAALQWFFQDGRESGLHRDAVYMGVDLSKVLLEEKEELVALLEIFCEENGFTLLLNTYEDLEAAGYIQEMYFEEGVLISFQDALCTEDKLVTEADEWKGGLAAVGAKMTVNKRSGEWVLEEITDHWVS